MARDEKIIITKYHGHCVASSCGKCLQRFCEMYDKNCQGTNKKCPFYAETGKSRDEVIDIIRLNYAGETETQAAEHVLDALLEMGEHLK